MHWNSNASPDLTFGVDIIFSAFGYGLDFLMVQVQFIFSGWSGSEFYLFWVRSGFHHVSPVWILSCQSRSGFYPFWVRYRTTDFIMLVRVRMLFILIPSPVPDFIKEVRVAGPVPDFIQFWVRFRVRILSIKFRSGYYLILRPGPDFIKHVWVRARVRILPTPVKNGYFFVSLTYTLSCR